MPSRPETSEGATGEESNASYSTPALEKGLDVVELLARHTSAFTKSQIARELNRTVSEIFRVVVCLERRGYIAQVSPDHYALTLKLFQLAQQHPRRERLIAESLPVMKLLAEKTQQSCHLGVLESEQVVIIAQTNSSVNLGFYVKLGSTVSVVESASGYVLLAHRREADCNRVLQEWKRRTGRKLPSGLRAHLDRIRNAGFEIRESYLVKGVINISFPIFDEGDDAIAALTIPFIQYNKPTVKEDATTAACALRRWRSATHWDADGALTRSDWLSNRDVAWSPE